jgi:CRISPR-associated protein Cas1
VDPVNALLSFVYTLLTNEVASAIKACGLDPYMGALHEISYGRPSLACDLVEEYRTFLGDRLVLGLINRKALSPDDFIYRSIGQRAYTDEKEMQARRPVEMRPPIRRALVSAYEQMMQRAVGRGSGNGKVTYRRLIMEQVRAFGNSLADTGEIYTPFAWTP